MSENNVSRRSLARAMRAGLLDGSAAWCVLLLALGFGLVGPESWWILAFGLPVLLLASLNGWLLDSRRRRTEQLRAVAVALVRDYWEAVPDARADALDYVPADILAEAVSRG